MLAQALAKKPRNCSRPRPTRAYWQEIPPEHIISWRGRQDHLIYVLALYGIEDCALVKDLGWSQGWEIAVGFDRILMAREWWRRERDNDEAPLPLEPQL